MVILERPRELMNRYEEYKWPIELIVTPVVLISGQVEAECGKDGGDGGYDTSSNSCELSKLNRPVIK